MTHLLHSSLESHVPSTWHEHSPIQIRPTRKTADRIRGDDSGTVFPVAQKPARPTRLYADVASGTASAANYGEARGAESRADFIHKLKIVFKELNETTIWLEVMRESSLLSPENIVAIVAENRELCRIIAASIKTARASSD